LQINISNGGCLPGPVAFRLSTFSQGYQGRALQQTADAYIRADTANGFMISYVSRNGGFQGGYSNIGYTGGAPSASRGTLQILTEWSDPQRSTMAVALIYILPGGGATQIASGRLFGQSGFAQGGGQAGIGGCGFGANGGGYGAYGSGYPNAGYSNGGYSNGGYYTGGGGAVFYGGGYVPFSTRK
jgi:hypothetical protein